MISAYVKMYVASVVTSSTMPCLKTVVENVMFCLKEGQDFGNRAAHPQKEFLGVPPGRIVYFTITERIHAR